MDFKDSMKAIAERINKFQNSITNEETTKTSLVLPFIQALGYDSTDPNEFVAEYTCDVGIKKGEKIDYAIMKNGNPIVLVECKQLGTNLYNHDDQLIRYFTASKARFGVLTDGRIYKFFTDLDKPNIMDEKPFFVVDFHKSYFEISKIIDTATELKYMTQLKSIINSEINNPSEQMIRLLAKQVYTGQLTSKVYEQFSNLIRKSFSHVVDEIITTAFKSALAKENEPKEKTDPPKVETADTSGIETTIEELEAFMIVKALIRNKIDINRLNYRDYKGFFGIMLDDSRNSTICRLYFSNTNKTIGIVVDKNEQKFEISSLNDIYQYADMIQKSVLPYMK
jgi:hypothetical protein